MTGLISSYRPFIALIALLVAVQGLPAGASPQAIHETGQWRALLHYGGWTQSDLSASRVMSSGFFLSPEGSGDPAAELAAAIATFSAEIRSGIEPDSARLCRYPARFLFLARHFPEALDIAALDQCVDFQRYRRHVAAMGVTLLHVIPEGFSPGSILGHTALRFDRGPADSDKRMLDLVFHNLVPVGERAPWRLYALRSFYALESYANFYAERAGHGERPIMEYRLRLSPEEVDAMVAHAYELLGARFRYNLFLENCVTEMLRSLRASGNDAMLQPWRYSERVAPAGALLSLSERELLDPPHYRPADPKEVIPAREAQLNHLDRQRAWEIAQTAIHEGAPARALLAGISPEEQAAIVDLAIDYFRQIERHNRRLAADVISPQLRELLALRRELPPAAVPKVNPPFDPLDARYGRRWEAFGQAVDMDRYGVGWQLVAFSADDPAAGQSLLTTTSWLQVRVSSDGAGHTRLETARAFSALHLPVSVAGTWEWARHRDHVIERRAQDALTLDIVREIGRAFDLPLPGRAHVFALGGAVLRLGEALDEHVQLAASTHVGLLWAQPSLLTHRLEAIWRPGALGDRRDSWSLVAASTLQIGRSNGLQLRLERRGPLDETPDNRAQASWYYYY